MQIINLLEQLAINLTDSTAAKELVAKQPDEIKDIFLNNDIKNIKTV